MIAMSLSCNPKLLIADEPTTALDVTIQAQIVDLIKRLQKQLGMAVMWITHDLGVAASLVKTINVMYAGYLVERGEVKDIFKRPRHPYTQGLLASLPRLDQEPGSTLSSIPGNPPSLINLPAGCPFVPRCNYAVDQCREEMPVLEATEEEGHTVACWRWQQVAESLDA
jgi:oligopeptide/dipeptide ABC transporter ATP-binding protein